MNEFVETASRLHSGSASRYYHVCAIIFHYPNNYLSIIADRQLFELQIVTYWTGYFNRIQSFSLPLYNLCVYPCLINNLLSITIILYLKYMCIIKQFCPDAPNVIK